MVTVAELGVTPLAAKGHQVFPVTPEARKRPEQLLLRASERARLC
jgi:hypothetical protein